MNILGLLNERISSFRELTEQPIDPLADLDTESALSRVLDFPEPWRLKVLTKKAVISPDPVNRWNRWIIMLGAFCAVCLLTVYVYQQNVWKSTV